METAIALFTYDRIVHTQRTVAALKRNLGSDSFDLIIYSDAARSEENAGKVAAVRNYLKSIDGFKSVKINNRASNYGLAKSIVEGVTEVLKKYDQIIVLEDDMETSKYFLVYMTEALEKFVDDERVISVHGYTYPVKEALPDAFFLRGADCWGWATWQRGWKLFNSNGRELLNEITRKGLTKEFDFNGTYKYSEMLKSQIDGKNNSWAILWYASAFVENKLTLYPGKSLVQNIGHDNTGTHCIDNDIWKIELAEEKIQLQNIDVMTSGVGFNAFEKNFRKNNYIFNRLRRKLKSRYYSQLFNPKWMGIFINPFYFARKNLASAVKEFAGELNGDLLDVGCGVKPYRNFFDVSSYRGLDIDNETTRRRGIADDFYDGVKFPYGDEQFNSVLCNQVLEHVFNPNEFLLEINRTMKKGGKMLLTVPFVWDEHEQPYDYARYSSFGLKYLLEKNGFRVIKSKKLGGDPTILFQLINAYLYKIIKEWSPLNKIMFTLTVMSVVNMLGVVVGWILPKNPDLFLDHALLVEKRP